MLSPGDETPAVTDTGIAVPIIQPPSEPPRSPSPDIRVSWIYQLRKSDLAVELIKFRLDPSGTVDEMRKRLIGFFREGLPAPPTGPSSPPPLTTSYATPFPFVSSRFPSTTTTIAPPTVTIAGNLPTAVSTLSSPFVTITPAVNRPILSSWQPPAYPETTRFLEPTTLPASSIPPYISPLKLYHWNLKFSGEEDPAAFLEQLEERIIAENIIPERILPQMPELLHGRAALWFRNNRSKWRTWQDFASAFKSYYFPLNWHADLIIEINRRLHRPDESVLSYITDMQTLMRRHGEITLQQQLNWLYQNLLPEYRMQLRTYQFTDVEQFVKAAREYELLSQEIENAKRASKPVNYYHPNTAPLPPKTTPRRQNLPTQQHNVRVVPAVRQEFRASPPVAVARCQQPTGSLHPLPTPSNRITLSTRPEASQPLCWRCGEYGHFRNQCKGPSKLFCSRCLKANIMTKDCTCSQPPGNARRTVE